MRFSRLSPRRTIFGVPGASRAPTRPNGPSTRSAAGPLGGAPGRPRTPADAAREASKGRPGGAPGPPGGVRGPRGGHPRRSRAVSGRAGPSCSVASLKCCDFAPDPAPSDTPKRRSRLDGAAISRFSGFPLRPTLLGPRGAYPGPPGGPSRASRGSRGRRNGSCWVKMSDDVGPGDPRCQMMGRVRSGQDVS